MPKISLDKHHEKYQSKAKEIIKQNENYLEILRLISYMQSNKIKCLKYNHALDAEY